MAHVHIDTPFGVLERGAAADEDDDHDDWKTHGDIYDATGQADAAEHAQPDDEPDKGTPADGLPDEAFPGVTGVGQDRAVWGKGAIDGFDVGEDTIVVKGLAIGFPGERALERVAEVVHDPAEDWHVVASNDIAGEDGANADAPCALVEGVESDDTAAAGRLAEGDLEDEQRDGEKAERDEVGNEPLQAVVLEDDRGVS